jgi:hypothetical protein
MWLYYNHNQYDDFDDHHNYNNDDYTRPNHIQSDTKSNNDRCWHNW